MSRLLVTGASGFIGRHLGPRLRSLNNEVWELSSKTGDIGDEKTWRHLPATDVVFHLAGRAHVPTSWNETADFVRVNVSGTVRALDYCLTHHAHLIYVSAYLYGIPVRLPIAETDPINPNNPYALSKHLAEQVCEFYAKYRGVKVTVLRPFNVFGVGQQSQFLIPKIIDQVRCNTEIRVKDLVPRRDYIYVNDLLDALVKAVKAPDHYSVFNIGSGISLSVKEIIDIIQRIANTSLPVNSEFSERPQEIPDVRADISKAERLIGWKPRHSFADGISMLLE